MYEKMPGCGHVARNFHARILVVPFVIVCVPLGMWGNWKSKVRNTVAIISQEFIGASIIIDSFNQKYLVPVMSVEISSVFCLVFWLCVHAFHAYDVSAQPFHALSSANAALHDNNA